MFNVLDDAFIEVRTADGHGTTTLPELFEAWSSGRAVEVLGTAPYQRTAVHRWFCQLAAMSVQHSDEDRDDFQTDAGSWRKRLLGLAPLDQWNLVNDDLRQTALMQVNIPAAEEKKFLSSLVPHANETTRLPSEGKMHGQKAGRDINPSPWRWLVCLVNAQTMLGYSGAGNYGVFRMNGGQASRPCFSAYPDPSPGARWKRDVQSILRMDRPAGSDYMAPPGRGVTCLWTVPWDGESQIPLSELDWLCVEVCRRFRLVHVGGGKLMLGKLTSKNRRVSEPGAHKKEDGVRGHVGDPWMPYVPGGTKNNRGGSKALTVSEEGIGPRMLCRMLFSGDEDNPIQGSPLMSVGPNDVAVSQDVWLHADVLVGGQGKTGGWHEVSVPVPAPLVRKGLLGQGGGELREQLAMYSSPMLTAMDQARGAYLDGVRELMGGRANEKSKLSEAARRAGWASVQAKMEAEFFPHLWLAHAEGDLTLRAWKDFLVATVRKSLERDAQSLPVDGGMRYSRVGLALGKADLLAFKFRDSEEEDE